jgi:site-specific DNA-cytosine methylase
MTPTTLPLFDSPRVILSLFDYSGNWSRPYREAGYEVHQFDLKCGHDIRLLKVSDFPKSVHGILSAPPCTHFAVSGARWWADKGETALTEGLALVDAVYRIVAITRPVWWVLENPVGRLNHYIGKPAMYFQPCDYGDPYTKKTGLWGQFNTDLIKNPVHPYEGSKMHRLPPGEKRQELRSMTPPGFARAFFEANR